MFHVRPISVIVAFSEPFFGPSLKLNRQAKATAMEQAITWYFAPFLDRGIRSVVGQCTGDRLTSSSRPVRALVRSDLSGPIMEEKRVQHPTGAVTQWSQLFQIPNTSPTSRAQSASPHSSFRSSCAGDAATSEWCGGDDRRRRQGQGQRHYRPAGSTVVPPPSILDGTGRDVPASHECTHTS